jgi:hypothetical protein
MLGRFLELRLASSDIAGSVHFYEQLGFQQLACNDAWPHAYCALSDGDFTIGLHAVAEPACSLSFVHANVARYAHELESSGIRLQSAQLGEDDFHRLTIADPAGHAIELLEARTFSPALPTRGTGRCGQFYCYTMPTEDMAASAAFWENAGLVAFEELQQPFPHRPLSGDGLNLALHYPEFLRQSALVFVAPDCQARIEALSDLGFKIPGGRLRTPEGVFILMFPGEL